MMTVKLIAATGLVRDSWVAPNIAHQMQLDSSAGDAENLIEYAGRRCYNSFHKPNPKTERNKDYIANIKRQRHFSVLEHSSATFEIEVSRACSHEIIRHRHFSFSQESQRFVSYNPDLDPPTVIPPAFRGTEWVGKLYQHHTASLELYEEAAQELISNGLTRKQAREAARAFLPNAHSTTLVVTGNYRSWIEFIEKRNDPGADAEIRELAQKILRELVELSPSVFSEYND